MDKYIESCGIRITVTADHIKVDATEELPDRPLKVEVDYQKMRQTEDAFNPRLGGVLIHVPPGVGIDATRCDVRVIHFQDDGTPLVLCQWQGGAENIFVQTGWDKCYACQDSKLRPGQMWVGKDAFGYDRWITCPVCQGTNAVPRYKVLDPATGLEIDYEQQGGRLAAVTP